MNSSGMSYGPGNASGSKRPAWTCGLQHANDAIDEVRKAEFFRQGKQKRGLIKGKKWLLMSR